MKVYLFLANGFEEIEAITVMDVLRRANIEMETVSITDHKEVKGAHDIVVVSDILYEQCDFTQAGMLILPGGQPGTNNLFAHKGLTSMLSTYASEQKWIAAICAAPTILGKLGLLKGRSALCYPGCEEELFGAMIETNKSTVVDKNIITSKGPGTALEFAFTIVGELKDAETVQLVKQGMLL